MHQAFLDLVVAGTGLLLVEEAPLGEASAFRFTAVPLRDAVLEEGPSGRLDTVYRTAPLTAAEIRRRYPSATAAGGAGEAATPEARHPVLEAVWPDRARHALRRDAHRRRRAGPCCWRRAASPRAPASPSAG